MLGRRGFPIESRGSPGLSGGRRQVSVNVCVADLEPLSPGGIDDRKIEVLGGGLPLFHGAQLAVDVTLVSPVRGDWSA